MGRRDVVDSNFRMRGSASHIVELIPGAGLADGVWATPPVAESGTRGVRYRIEGGEGIADLFGVVLKNENGTFVRRELPTLPARPIDGITASWINEQIQDIKATQGSQYGGGEMVLPAGLIEIDEPIVLSNHVGLRAAGVGTVIQCADDFTDEAAIIVEGQSNRFVRLSNIRLHGNKEHVAGTVDGIAFEMDDVANDEYGDPYWTVDHVVITDFTGKAAHTIGRGCGRADRVIIRDCDDEGWHNEAPDCAFSGLEISGCGGYGWLNEGSNTRIWGSKCFYNGRLDGAIGAGFAAINCSNVTGFGNESQDNNGHGFLGKDGDRIHWTECIADSNNAGHASDPDQSACGFFFDNSSYSKATGQSFDRGLVSSGNTRQQKYAIGFANGVPYTSFDLVADGNSAGHVFQGWHTNIRGNINASDGGMQELSYAATRTPNPTLGNYVVIGVLTGNITINPPSAVNSWTGQELTLEFTQDGDGGAVVTFAAGIDSDFILNPGAGKRGTVTFRYNGTDWVQTASVTNL
jgi:hypothetical protein